MLLLVCENSHYLLRHVEQKYLMCMHFLFFFYQSVYYRRQYFRLYLNPKARISYSRFEYLIIILFILQDQVFQFVFCYFSYRKHQPVFLGQRTTFYKFSQWHLIMCSMWPVTPLSFFNSHTRRTKDTSVIQKLLVLNSTMA